MTPLSFLNNEKRVARLAVDREGYDAPIATRLTTTQRRRFTVDNFLLCERISEVDVVISRSNCAL